MQIKPLNISTLRLTGMASGLDTDSMVNSLLKIDQYKLDKQYRLKTKLEWKSEALREINTLIKNFRQQNLSVLNPSKNMLSPSSYKTYKITMLSDSSAVSVSADSYASAGTVTINSIGNLAKAAKVSSSGVFSTIPEYGIKLSELDFATDLEFDASGKIMFSINGKDFEFDAESTLSHIINTVNSSEAGVVMRYSSLTNGFTITSSVTGSAAEIEIVNISGNAFSAGGAFGIAEGTVNGEDAEITIDGVTVTRSSNTFTIDGITYTLKDETSAPINFMVERDNESVINRIKGFVDAYNSLVTTLYAKITEERFSSYEPLTEAEQEALSETQIEKWEAKAKSGLLRNDLSIRSLLSQMRGAFYAAVSGAGISASDIGLTTDAYSYDGQIVINESKLRAALQSNPDQVAKLFSNTSSATDKTVKYNESGVIVRISDALLDYVSVATDVTLYSLDSETERAADKLNSLQEWLYKQEDRYYQKFSEMESALASLNNQSGWLSAMLGALTTNK